MTHVAPAPRAHVPLVGKVRRRVLVAVACGVGVVVALLLTLVPLWLAHHDAEQAANALTHARTALASGDLDTAQKDLGTARDQVGAAQGHLHGPAAGLWSHVPLLGSGVDNGRHLVAGLDEATQAATIGVDLLNKEMAPDSTLIRGSRIDIDEVQHLSRAIRAVKPHLLAARREIAAVHGTGFLFGNLNQVQSQATQDLATSETSYRRLHGLLRALPEVLGANGPRTYLVAIMNPAELRYSGGATLQVATLRFDDGTFELGPSRSVADVDQTQPFLTWAGVPGDPFHSGEPTRLANATFSPWWQVSGEELLRAWQAQTGQRCQGLITVDLQALAAQFEVSGPIQVKGYGELDASNLVHTLAGSYDKFQDPYQRRRLNNAIAPAFQQRLLSGGDYVAKAHLLLNGAKGRHVAFYFRDSRAQRAFGAVGMSGNLSKSGGDYLGVFSQNLNGSKTDYWQTRQVSTRVALRADGSADEVANVITQNPSPPYELKGKDPRTGYATRWLGTLLGVFLPQDSHVSTVTVDGRDLRHPWLTTTAMHLRGVRNRLVVRHSWLLGPDQSGRLDIDYHVPRAATVDKHGDLTYRISLDPQDLVSPQSNSVTLSIPSGYRFGTLPSGWSTTSSHTAVLRVPRLIASSSWEVPVVKE
ncbi:MAG: DUF4012 domain-containing protein [Nocardioides sp.]